MFLTEGASMLSKNEGHDEATALTGRGCFAKQPFRKGHKIGEMVGERIGRAEAKRRILGMRIIRCVELDALLEARFDAPC